MSWATIYIDKLKKGETVKFRPHGNSMKPRVNSGDLVTVRPLNDNEHPCIDDIVLCKVKGKQYLHLIKAVHPNGTYQIGNNRGGINGWTSLNNIFGIVISVES